MRRRRRSGRWTKRIDPAEDQARRHLPPDLDALLPRLPRSEQLVVVGLARRAWTRGLLAELDIGTPGLLDRLHKIMERADAKLRARLKVVLDQAAHPKWHTPHRHFSAEMKLGREGPVEAARHGRVWCRPGSFVLHRFACSRLETDAAAFRPRAADRINFRLCSACWTAREREAWREWAAKPARARTGST